MCHPSLVKMAPCESMTHRAVQGGSGTGGTHMPPVPLESLLHLLLCSVQINQCFAMVCSMNQMPDENKRLTFVGFSGRVITIVCIMCFMVDFKSCR